MALRRRHRRGRPCPAGDPRRLRRGLPRRRTYVGKGHPQPLRLFQARLAGHITDLATPTKVVTATTRPDRDLAELLLSSRLPTHSGERSPTPRPERQTPTRQGRLIDAQSYNTALARTSPSRPAPPSSSAPPLASWSTATRLTTSTSVPPRPALRAPGAVDQCRVESCPDAHEHVRVVTCQVNPVGTLCRQSCRTPAVTRWSHASTSDPGDRQQSRTTSSRSA